MLPWFYEHWAGITTRTERKGVRIKENMAKFFEDYAAWTQRLINDDLWYLKENGLHPQERYELMWDDCLDSVKFLGRYVGIKLLEYYRRYCDIDISIPDVRPVDGWSPRLTLSLLFPDRIDYHLSNDSEVNLEVIQDSSEEALWILQNDYGFGDTMDMFNLEVVLCNYRQSYVGKKLYPGRTHDTERRYSDKIMEHWWELDRTEDLHFYEARARTFPHEHLSEFNQWHGVRDLGQYTREGFIWSDLLYDYDATMEQGRSILDPVRREWGDKQKAVKEGSYTIMPARLLEISEGELYQRGVFIDMDLSKKLELLNTYGVDVVVNFWHTADEELRPHVWRYDHHFYPDGKEFDKEWLLNYAGELADLIEDGHTVLVHCYGGNNRSGLMSALIMRELYTMTGADALEWVCSKKKRALHNEHFAEWLRSLPELPPGVTYVKWGSS
jgi:protein-tyrosine phosphatase